MAEQQKKLKKFFNARSNLESDLCNIHKDITDAIDRQDRRVKVERLVSKLKDVFSKLVQKNEELFDLASKAENPDSIYPVLEQWLDDVTNNNDKFLLASRNYIDSVAHRDTVCEGVNPQGQSKRSSRRTASSISSQRLAKLKREEAEKQEQAAMRLAKHKHEITMRKKELEIQMEQMALQELEDDHRQRVAAAKLDEAELMDNHSLFSHHSSELNLIKDRGSDRSQRLVQDWVISVPAGNSLTAASESNFSRPGSATADPPVQDTAPSNPPENTSNVAGNLNHLEMLSQYTRPGVAISVAQQEALYREYLQAQLQQSLSDQRAYNPSGSGKVNQVPVDVQNVALPPPQLLMQPPRPPTPVLAPTNSIFVPDFSTNPQINKFLGPKSSSVPCHLHMSSPHVPQQQNPPQSNIPLQTQVPITHSSHNVPPPLNPLVNPPPVFPPQQLYNSQPPVVPSPIPVSATTYLPVPNIPQQNIVPSPQTRLVPCPTAQKPPQNCNLDLNLWCFPQYKPPNVNQSTSNATIFKNVQPFLPPSTANPAISHPILQMSAQHNPNSNHAATCSIPVNPFSTTTNIAPPFVTPVIHPTYGHTAPIPLCWGGPPHPTPPAPASENASLIKAFTDALNSKRNDPLPQWKLSEYNGHPLQWHEWYGQFKSAIDSQSLTDDVKLTYLKTLVTGKAKTAIAEFAYCGAMYKDALRTLERKFGQPQAVVSAHLDKLSSFSPLKMHNSDNIINYSG